MQKKVPRASVPRTGPEKEISMKKMKKILARSHPRIYSVWSKYKMSTYTGKKFFVCPTVPHKTKKIPICKDRDLLCIVFPYLNWHF